jgi:tetratricopeptide (TPR) repeat protein
MRSISVIFASLVLVGCASTSNEKSIPAEVQNIKNSDFTAAKEIKYIKSQDSIRLPKDLANKANILKLESLDRSKLYEDFKNETPLDKLAQTCYEKEFEDAKEQIQELEEKYRSNIIFWNQVATCFMLEKEYRKALLFYNKALEFNPSYAPVLNNIGVMYENQNQDEKALLSYQRAIKADKYARTPKLNAALLYLEYSLYSKAQNILSGLNKLDVNDNEVLNAYATSLLMSGNTQSALSLYKRIDKDLFEIPSFGLNYAMALYISDNKKKSIDIFEDIDIDKKDLTYSYYLNVKSVLGVR